MAEGNQLRRQRAAVKGQMTRLQTFFETGRECTVEDAETRLEKIKSLWDEFERIQRSIEAAEVKDDATSDEVTNENESERAAFEEKYYAATADARRVIRQDQVQARISPANNTERFPTDVQSFRRQNRLKLPEIKLPEFDGDYTKWTLFKNSFETTIHNDDELPDSQKFQYLAGVLRGEARQVIEGFGSENYNQAWQLLRNAYNNEIMIVDAHLERLFDLPSTSKDDKAESIRRLAWHIQRHVAALKSLKQPVEHWDAVILHFSKKKLDFTEKKDWQHYIKKCTPQDMPKLEDFVKFLTERSHTLRSINQDKGAKPNVPAAPTQRNNKRLVLAVSSGHCKLCQGGHSTYQCEELLKLSAEERTKCVVRKGLCINCLNKGHFARDCKASTCKKCQKRHNTVLHRETVERETDGPTADSTAAPAAVHCTSLSSEVSAYCGNNDNHILLSTAQVYVRTARGDRVVCRALLDSASHLNLMTTELLCKLGIPWEKGTSAIVGVERMQTGPGKVARAQIEAVHGSFSASMECRVLSSITVPVPQIKIETRNIIVPEGAQLADPTYHEPGEIDLLIGAGLYWKLLMGAPRNRIDGQPALQNTKLGWILGGEVCKSMDAASNRVSTCLAVTNDQLSKQVERFWEVEGLPEIKHYTAEDRACEKHFIETVQRMQDGRFIVRLPLRKNSMLGESRDQALRRLEALERRFRREPKLKEAYVDFMTEYQTSGHMTEISEKELPPMGERYFIPHQAVIRPDSLTTKLRVVFDASAKTTSGLSLNDKLIAGPNLQKDLFRILLRFRVHQYVITADIAQMFRQILIDTRDRFLQLILWRENAEEAGRIYRLNTVTYGTASAPYHAMRCLLEVANQHQDEYPRAAAIIQEDFYMDDVLTGGRTLQETIEIQRQLLELLKRGQFSLRKWRSNEPQALRHLAEQSGEHLLTIDKDTAKTLGVLWDATQDSLQYKVDLSKKEAVTKRAVLSQISQVFDPLGLAGPVLIKGKIFMQKLWTEELMWDQPLPPTHSKTWVEYIETLPELNALRVARNVNLYNAWDKFDLIGFGDASQVAFGACIYVVSRSEGGAIRSHLFCAKSKVAPLKTISLPRLELEAALLLSQLYDTVRRALPGRIRQVRLWSDSTIVLGWIRTEPHTLKTFVANRVAKIQERTEGAIWAHVPSEDNPADLLSRGTTVSDLQTSDLWWNGPYWIRENNQQPEFMLEPENDLPELKPLVLVTAVKRGPVACLLQKFSSFGKLCRVIAYCFRFGNRVTRDKNNTSSREMRPPNSGERRKAECAVLRQVQEEEFKQELQCLKNKRDLPAKGPLAALCPFLNKDGLICVGGRLRHASIPEEQKHPVVLPKGHHISKLIMREEHERMLHCPPEQLLHHIRQRYWPVNGRRLACRTVKGCLRCFRFRPVVADTIMGDLPKERVAMLARPFTVTGVDYAGPFQIRESRRRGRMQVSKGYVAAFVCFSTKAVHLEMVSSLTTEAFLAALSRFVARRGLCAQLFSDNGRNFVGAARELKEVEEFLKREEAGIASFLSERRISWSFNPPRSPHFGGLWEAAIKSMKRNLYTSTQGKVLTLEEYNTLVIQIEAILNSRPLTPLSSDPTDLAVLTPAHFLVGDTLTQPVERNLTSVSDNCLSSWRHLQRARQLLWQRWQREYLQELQRRSKWTKTGPNIELNALVLLVEDNVPSLHWPLGRVVATHPGPDGRVRVVTVRTRAGCFKRAIRRLCPLPREEKDI